MNQELLAENKDQIIPDGKWTFDGDVTSVFDDMLARSIPQYDLMRRSCFDVGCRFVKQRTDIVDLGCARGEALAMFVDKFGAGNRFVGLEVSDPMLEVCRNRFKGYISTSIVDVRKHDLRGEYPPLNACLTLAVLTLQFTPIECRQKILRDIWKSTLKGGALILVEKVLGANAELDEIFVRLYYAMKRANGYTDDQIERKRLSLQGVLVPVTARWNEELLRDAGFSYVDCFWRWMNFAGWIAAKE